MKAKEIIEKLGLERHPEGGWFGETYRSDEFLGDRNRNVSTAIYYLLEGEDKSKLHRLKSDEIWHFYAGDSLVIEGINPDGSHFTKILGSNLDKGEQLQIVVRRDTWFGAYLENGKSFVLLGCTVAPGFNFDDFELGDREILIEKYPQHKELIEKLT